MQIEISKTDYKSLLELIDRCTSIIKGGNYSLREYNAARRLRLLKKKIEKRNKE